MKNYQDFLEQRFRLSEELERLAEECERLGLPDRAGQMRERRQTLERDAFRLMVLGEFKRGKSTLINAMLGADVLPAKVAPCTAVITELRWGEQPSARLHFRDAREPQDIPIQELKQHLCITEEEDEESLRTPYRKVEVYYPLALLKQNVELVDSPGLNEHEVRNELALEYLPKADALLIVLSCEQALSASEMAFVERLGTHLRHVFFLWNRYDSLTSPEDRADLEARSRRALEPLLAASPRIFPLSARQALLARRKGESLESSGLPGFEGALEQFLALERGRLKLSGPLNGALATLQEVLSVDLPQRMTLLEQPLSELQERYLQVRPRLDALQAQRLALLAAVDRRQAALLREVQAAWAEELEKILPQLPAVTREVQPGIWTAVRSGKLAQRQVADHLGSWLEQRVGVWQKETLEPMLRRHMAALETELNQQLGDFLTDLENIRSVLMPGFRVGEGEELTPLSRVMGAVSGLLVGGLGGALEGAGYGFSHMLGAAGYHLALTLGLLVAGAGTPVILGASLVLGVARSLYAGSSAVERIRERVVEEVSAGLRQDLPRLNSEIEQHMSPPFTELKELLSRRMEGMVEELEASIRQILEEKAAGEAAIAAERKRLEGERERLLDRQSFLEAMRQEMVG